MILSSADIEWYDCATLMTKNKEPGLPWETIATEVIAEGKAFKFKRDRVKLPSPGDAEITYIYLDHPGSVVIVPLIGDGSTLLIEQYRYPPRISSVEFPAGGIDKGEDFESAARRELLEELGLKANSITKLGSFYPSNSSSNEIMNVFLAEGLEQGESSPEVTEQIIISEVPFSEIEQKIQKGEITDGPTIIAYFLAKKFLEGRNIQQKI